MAYRAAVITVSDKGFRGERIDTSGPALCALLKENGFEIACTAIVPDEIEAIREELLRCADQLQIPLILTTGGTGFAERDVTPEATKEVITRETPGIPEAMRAESMRITPRGCLSRSAAGIRGRTLIINRSDIRCSEIKHGPLQRRLGVCTVVFFTGGKVIRLRGINIGDGKLLNRVLCGETAA